MDNARWFLLVLDGGRVGPLPVFTNGLTITAEEIGDIEIRSGRARIAPDYEWPEKPSPLDHPVATGSWGVRRLIASDHHVADDDTVSDLGPMASVLVHEDADPGELDWQVATSDGRPIRAMQDQVAISDADMSLTFGTAAPQRAAFGSIASSKYYRRPKPERIVPDGSIMRMAEGVLPIYFTPNDRQPGVPRWVFLGMEEFWVGIDSSGIVRAIVHDVLSSYLRGVAGSRVEDVWSDPVGSTGGSLDPDVHTSPEVADITRFLAENPDEFWFLGTMDVGSGLGVIPARMVRWSRPADPDFSAISRRFPLTFSGPARIYASWHGQADGQLLVRLGDAAPTTWTWLDEPGFLDANGGELIIASLADLSADAPQEVSTLLSDVIAWPNSRLNRSRDERLQAAHWYAVGEEPGFWLAGLDEDDNVTALYAAVDADTTILTARPATLDLPLLTAVQLSSNLDDDDLENLARFRTSLSEHGALPPLDRGMLHWMANRLGISVLD